MRKWASVSLFALALVVSFAAPSDARHVWHRGHFVRSHAFVGFGPSFWWGPPYWYYPPPYYVYEPRTVVVEQPPVYVEQARPPAPPPPPPPPPPEVHWYYCQGARAYYPDVQTCGEPWVKVPPR